MSCFRATLTIEVGQVRWGGITAALGAGRDGDGCPGERVRRKCFIRAILPQVHLMTPLICHAILRCLGCAVAYVSDHDDHHMPQTLQGEMVKEHHYSSYPQSFLRCVCTDDRVISAPHRGASRAGLSSSVVLAAAWDRGHLLACMGNPMLNLPANFLSNFCVDASGQTSHSYPRNQFL